MVIISHPLFGVCLYPFNMSFQMVKLWLNFGREPLYAAVYGRPKFYPTFFLSTRIYFLFTRKQCFSPLDIC